MLSVQGPTVRAYDSAKRLPASDGSCPVCCGLTYVTCIVYLDDIIVFAKDFNTPPAFGERSPVNFGPLSRK